MDDRTLKIIRADINRTTTERLQNWLTDSLDLYKMGGLRYGEALADLLMEMSMGLALLADLCQLDRDEFMEVIEHTYDKVKKAKAKQEDSDHA